MWQHIYRNMGAVFFPPEIVATSAESTCSWVYELYFSWLRKFDKVFQLLDILIILVKFHSPFLCFTFTWSQVWERIFKRTKSYLPLSNFHHLFRFWLEKWFCGSLGKSLQHFLLEVRLRTFRPPQAPALAETILLVVVSVLWLENKQLDCQATLLLTCFVVLQNGHTWTKTWRVLLSGLPNVIKLVSWLSNPCLLKTMLSFYNCRGHWDNILREGLRCITVYLKGEDFVLCQVFQSYRKNKQLHIYTQEIPWNFSISI